jgi:succinate-semialdehyde dehydrogenase/glutarate-semialdehyde dehydrogenase
MQIMRDETFGPVVCIQRASDEEEALRLANDSPYGLSGSVFTKDKARGVELAKRMITGGVCVNDMTLTYGVPEAPFGGRKESGVGQVNGKKGLLAYCHEMPILVDRFGGKLQGGYPYTAKSLEGAKKFARFYFGSSLARWLA